MRIFTLCLLMLGFFALVSGTNLDGKLLRALKNIQHVSLDSTQDNDEPMTIFNINGKQRGPDNLEKAQPAPLLPANLHNKDLKLEIRPPDVDHDSQHNKVQTGIVIPGNPPQENVIADIIELRNRHGFKKLANIDPILEGDQEKIHNLEILQPENTNISNLVGSDGLQRDDIKPTVTRDLEEINEATQPETTLPDRSIENEKEANIEFQENPYSNMMTKNILKQKQQTATIDRLTGIPHNSVFSQNGTLEDDHRKRNLQTKIDINNNLHQQADHQQYSTNDTQKCSLRQTMAWEVCNKKMPCSSTCKTGDDCSFPYCNSLGQCECREAECSSDRMCYFWRIDCHGYFRCRNSKCFCE